MAILDLKSNLSGWRKPSTVQEQEKKKISSASAKAVYSTSNELKAPTDIKINKVDNSTSIQVPGAKKIEYKFYSINSKRGRSLPAISTLFGDTILEKISNYKEQRPEELNKVSSFIKITPTRIQHISSVEILKTILKEKLSLFIKNFPTVLSKVSLYKDQLPINILKLSLYKDQIPNIIDKLSLYKDQIPNLLDKLSLYKIQVPSLLNKLSLYKDQIPAIISKLSLYKIQVPSLLDKLSLYKKLAINAFDDLRSGAKGFTLNQKETDPSNFLGINGGLYTYPKTVREGRLKDITKIVGANQWQSTVLFPNRLNSTRYTRTTYSITKPYTTSLGITGDTLEKYFYRTNSPSARDILYTAFNLRDNSFNTGLVLFDQPLILSGIQRRGAKLNVFDTWKFDDGFIRGGVVTSTQRAIVDVLRIGKWFASTKGLLFIARQAGLQGSAPNTEADPLLAGRIRNGAFTLASSLANTATQHLGLRFRKDAIPFVPRNTYSLALASPLYKNRLEKAYNEVFNYPSLISNSPGLPIIALSGNGGPQSVYGIGVTSLKRYTISNSWKTISSSGVEVINTRKLGILGKDDIVKYINPDSNNNYLTRFDSAYDTLYDNSTFKVGYASNKSLTDGASQQYYTFDYLTLKERASNSSLSRPSIKNFLLNDSGQPLNSDIANAKWIPTLGTFEGTVIQNYAETSQHKRKKLRIPDYGRRGKDLRNPQPTMPDSDNFQNTYTGPGSVGMTDPIWQVNQTDKEAVDDFVKFMFHDLNTNERFRFRAYIENVSEDFNPNWQEVKILGRADSPYIYQGFERTVNVSFKAAALSRGDLMLMWDQLERLAKTTVPKYLEGFKMKGPLIKFTLGNWFINTPAFIRSLSYTVDNETPWEINLSDSGIYGGGGATLNSNSVGELPMIVSVQVNLQIFGETRPESENSLSDQISKPSGITESTHYNKGNLYPLGNEGLRGRRQFANYNVQTEG